MAALHSLTGVDIHTVDAVSGTTTTIIQSGEAPF